LTNAEFSAQRFVPNATGFQPTIADSSVNGSGSAYIYIAIRRGPMKTPESGTEVFAPVTYTGTGTTQKVTTGLQAAGNSLVIVQNRDGTGAASRVYDPLRGALKEIYTQSTNGEVDRTSIDAGLKTFDMDGFTFGSYNYNGTNESGVSYVAWQFNRAPGFFDVVCYTGNATARNLNHNLGAEPDLIIAKSRSNAEGWYVYVKSLGINKYLVLNTNANLATNTDVWGALTDINTSTTFHVGNDVATNGSGYTYVAYLFGSVAGVSKVGSYTGNGSSQTIDCGFANGARFVLIKATSGSPIGWVLFDSQRGIVSANDPYLLLNTTDAEVTSNDSVDPASSGFIVNQNATTNLNESTETYIYLAIA
jgi:hypothetical protein